MAIKLTTPYNPGDFDPGKSYTDVKIIAFLHDSRQKLITATCEFGVAEADGTWTPGKAKHRTVIIMDKPEILAQDGTVQTPASTDYTTVTATLPLSGETIYQAASRELYSYVSTSPLVPEFAGTVA